MSVVEFKYSRYKEYYLPVITIQINSGGRWHEVRVYVDYGAIYSVLEYKEAERLNIDTTSGEKIYIKVGDGGYISVNILSLPVKIGEIEFVAKIGFSRDLGVGFNILGRKNIFEKFTVCFNDKNSVLKFIANDD